MAQYQFHWPPFTRNIKFTAIALFVLWLASVLIEPLGTFSRDYMLVSSEAVVDRFQIWTIVTYALWHADFMHVLFNVFVLWIFGAEIDRMWKASTWWKFNILCAAGGGVLVLITQLIFGTVHPTLGYSGAVLGVVAAFAWYNWDRPLNFFFIPMTGKTLLLLFIAIDIVMVFVGREAIKAASYEPEAVAMFAKRDVGKPLYHRPIRGQQ
ncbi:MAG: rhomboid family intramembrane serine protease, partial [Bradymonadaceae bacterium]